MTEVGAYIDGQTVYFSVYDPSRGGSMDSRTMDTPANLTHKDGVVANNLPYSVHIIILRPEGFLQFPSAS